MEPPPNPLAPQRKFQTRRGVQRTSKADREAFERVEERRQVEAQREVERAAASTAAARVTGSYTPRGRGAFLGSSAERTRNESGGGVFGAAVPAHGVGAGRARGVGRGRGRGANVEGLVGVKEEVPVQGVVPGPAGGAGRGVQEGEAEQAKAGANVPKTSVGDGGKKAAKTKIKPAAERKTATKVKKNEGPVVLSSDEEGLAEEGERRDIETIEISSDDDDVEDGSVVGDDEEGPVSAKAKGKRRENQTRAPKSKMALRPVRAPREARETDGMDGVSKRKQLQRAVRHKDTGNHNENQPRSVRVDDYDMDLDDVGLSTDFSLQGFESQTKSSRKKGLSAKDKDPKFASETLEEHAERLRHAEDVRKIRHELSAMPPIIAPNDDVDMIGPDLLDQEMTSGRDGKMYLLQFPPLTPMLVDPAHKDDVVEIKQEPGAEGSRVDGALGVAAGTAQSSSKTKEKEKPPQIKKEDHESKDDVRTKIAAAAERAKILTADGARLPPGFAGTLNVHRSGKVTLEWGETNMEVRWGSEVDFLQDVVLVAGDQGQDVKMGEERSAFALGQVQKKLVVVPDWQKIYE